MVDSRNYATATDATTPDEHQTHSPTMNRRPTPRAKAKRRRKGQPQWGRRAMLRAWLPNMVADNVCRHDRVALLTTPRHAVHIFGARFECCE